MADWSTGMFDCCAEPGGAGLCLLSCCCPCIVVGQLAENMPAGSWCGPLAGNCCLAGTCYCCLPAAGSAAVMIASWAGIVGYMNGTLSAAAYYQGVNAASWLPAAGALAAFFLACSQRGAISRQYGMQDAVLYDCVCMYCCSCCALAQERREQLLRTEMMPVPGKMMQAPPTMNYMPDPVMLPQQQEQQWTSWQQQPPPQHPHLQRFYQ